MSKLADDIIEGLKEAVAYKSETIKTYSRPDQSQAMRQTHEAAAHDKWFRSKVEEGLKWADDPNAVWLTNDEVKAKWAKRKAELRLQAAGDKA